MIEYTVMTFLIIYLVIDNYRMRTQFSRELAKQKYFCTRLARDTFYHTNNVLFEGDVVSMDELEYDGTQGELIDSIFENIVVGVDIEQNTVKR